MTVKNEINAPNVVKTNQMKVISESIIRYTLGKSLGNAFFVTWNLERAAISAHTSSITVEKNIQKCSLCNLTSSGNSSLKEHMTFHTGETSINATFVYIFCLIR